MGRWITFADWRIETPPDNLAIQDNDCTNRDFAKAFSCAGQ